MPAYGVVHLFAENEDSERKLELAVEKKPFSGRVSIASYSSAANLSP